MNSKRAKKLRKLLMPAQQVNGRRVSSGALFRGTTAYQAVQVPKSTLNPARIRWGRTPERKVVMATVAVQGRLDKQCPRAAYQGIKKSLRRAA